MSKTETTSPPWHSGYCSHHEEYWWSDRDECPKCFYGREEKRGLARDRISEFRAQIESERAGTEPKSEPLLDWLNDPHGDAYGQLVITEGQAKAAKAEIDRLRARVRELEAKP